MYIDDTSNVQKFKKTTPHYRKYTAFRAFVRLQTCVAFPETITIKEIKSALYFTQYICILNSESCVNDEEIAFQVSIKSEYKKQFEEALSTNHGYFIKAIED